MTDVPDGWYPFGTHAGDDVVPPLEFSDVSGEDGMPLYERPVISAHNADIEALARALWAADGMGDGFEKEREVYIEQASGLLASDWLAERERAAAARALRKFVQWVATQRAYNGSDHKHAQSLYNECVNAVLPEWAEDYIREIAYRNTAEEDAR